MRLCRVLRICVMLLIFAAIGCLTPCWNQPIEIAFLPLDVPIAKSRLKPSVISSAKIEKLMADFCTISMQPKKMHTLPQIILQIRTMILKDSKTVSVIIAENFIIKSKEQLEDMNFEYRNEIKWNLPAIWKTFWKEIVFALQECAALGTCMVHLSSQVLASDELFFKAQYAAWVSHLIDRLKLTTFSIAYPHLCTLADNMLKSKIFYDREKFMYIINLMGQNLSADRKQQYIESFDSDEEITMGLNEVAVVATENEDVHFGLITPNKPLGLIHDQLKTTLDLDVS
ncbi:hypothetical protein M3Y97_00612100 [Aphelenchoides bicaudatus]|nr:hypothetical protein M3Y97_00612100 [Aphelenchoides bicaudatus]